MHSASDIPLPGPESSSPRVSGTHSYSGWTRSIPRVALLFALVVFSFHAFLWIPRLTYGFAMYYTYARLSLEGESLDRVYDDAYFGAKVREFGFDFRDSPNNAPTAGLAYMTVAWLPPVLAKVAWSCLSLLALACALKVLFGVSGIRPGGTVGLWLLTLVFLWRPAYDTLAFGQVYFILLLLFSICIKWLIRERPAGTAIPLALSLILKGYGVVPGLLLLLKKRWKEVGLTLGVTASAILATLPLLGSESWRAYYSTVLPSLGSLPSDANVAYQTINSLVRHLFTFDPLWLPHPALLLPGPLVSGLAYGTSAAAVLFVLHRCRLQRGPDKFLSFSAAVAAGVVTAPLAEEYHFVLFIPLIFALAARLETSGPERLERGYGTLFAAIAIAVMAAPAYYKTLQFSSFPLVLLAYPKLYAGLAILWYACGVMKGTEPAKTIGPGESPTGP